MEAVPRLHMLWFALKSSPEGTSFANLKKYIAEFYHEDPESYSKEVFALETLRNQAMHPGKDGCSVLKRYYCQLHSLQNRFPQLLERGMFSFTWKDLYQNGIHEVNDLRYEQAAVLFNIAALHTQHGASVTRGDVDGMKVACTHFQCAAWAFGELRERYGKFNINGDFMSTELLLFMQQVSFAQAQECILEKSLIDNRKPNIVAKVTAQIIVYYGAALAALLAGGEDGPLVNIIDNSLYKLWKKYVRFKISYLNCILYLYQGQHAEEQRKMGERVTLYQAAWEKLEEARKESKGLPDQKEINESLIFTADVVEAKRKNAKNENEFIYHEAMPELTSISAVQGANLVNGVAFSVTDPEVAGDDIFARLVPMKAHEASSMYSEEKAKILRKYGLKIEEKDNELNLFMSSLSLDNLNISEEKANKIPQGIVDRCAALNASNNAIPDLIASMSQLAEICADVEVNLKEISEMLIEEDKEEREFQASTGVKRTPNAHITELTREYQKYIEAHSKAGESNETLRKAMELHVNNLKILSKPLQDIQQSIPKLSTELNTAEIFKDVKLILNKVNEMKAQRAQFHADLRIAVNDDDITAKVIAHNSEESLQSLFEKELGKHDQLTKLIDQNLLAQQNILHALTESYAKAAPVLKTLTDVKNKRESFFSSLAASYDVYEDLLSKSAKGLEFYKKLSSNVNKLLTRLKSARAVQSEERQQRLKSVANNPVVNPTPSVPLSYAPMPQTTSATPKLRDYLKAKNANTNANPNGANITNPPMVDPSGQNPYIPSVRPNPLGSENPSQAACSTYYQPSAAPNEPPPPYSLQQQQYYDSSMPGYTNPMFQQQQQHIAPPAYKPQASPNSSFTNMTQQMAQLSMQRQQQQQQQQQQQEMQHLQQQQANLYAQQQQQQQGGFPSIYNPPNNNASMQGNIYANSNASAPPLNHFSNTYQNSNNLQQQQQQQQQQVPSQASYGGVYGQQGLLIAAPNSTPNISASQASQMAPNPPSQQAYPPQNPYMQAAISSGAASTAIMPATQPLYVVTNASNTNTIPSTLQAPYVMNQNFQGSLTNPQMTLQASPLQNSQPQQIQPTVPGASQGQAQNLMNPTLQPQQDQQQQQQYFNNVAVASSANPQTNQNFTPYASSIKHPGYSFNPQTGQYEYGSGYQQAATLNNKFYGQYTSALHNASLTGTDSEAANKINVATGFNAAPIISHTKNVANAAASSVSSAPSVPSIQQSENQSNESNDCRYYTPPYGYQSNGLASAIPPMQQAHLHQPEQAPQSPKLNSYDQKSIYIQSGSSSIANTQTTGSGTQYASSAHPTPSGTPAPNTPVIAGQKPMPNENSSQNVSAPPSAVPKKSSNIDLLSDIDFSGNVPAPILPEPILKPLVVSTPPPSQIDEKEPSTPTKPPQTEEPKPPTPSPEKSAAAAPTAAGSSNSLQQVSPPISSENRKPSIDNLSICSDLSSLENFDWDSVSIRSDHQQPPSAPSSKENHSNSNLNLNTFQLKNQNPFNDDKVLKYFHKEVEQFEKIIESINVKMLNGHTHLTAKWKELQDLLNKDNTKRITTIAKLFPEKNRSLDCLPYDHARIKLDKDTDNYINAAYIKNLGTGCPNVIIAQTPQQNTINDFWSMVWSEKARTILCLHTTNEMLDPYWPQEVDQESYFDDYTLRCTEVVHLSHCVKYHLKLSLVGADPIIDLSVLQIKAWNKISHSHILGIAANALEAHQKICLETKSPNAPLVTNCLTGSERSELLVIALCSIVATQIKRPALTNVVDVWYRICSQRQNSLRDPSILEQSMQIVLTHAHDVLNKRGIMTSYQMKIAPQVASKEKEEIKDPLNELDPLWKLK